MSKNQEKPQNFNINEDAVKLNVQFIVEVLGKDKEFVLENLKKSRLLAIRCLREKLRKKYNKTCPSLLFCRYTVDYIQDSSK